MRLTRRSWGLAIVAGIAVAAPSPAQADRAAVPDVRGDAKARWDILRLEVSNGARILRVRIRYRGPLRTHTSFLANVGLDVGRPADSTLQPDFTADMLVGSSDPAAPDRHELYRGSRRLRCDGFAMRSHARRRLVTVRIPQRCLGGDAERLRLAAYSYQVRGAPDEADYIDEYSRWIARG